MIRLTKKFCFAFKVMGAGRNINSPERIEEVLRTAYSNIKPTDAIIVGMTGKFKDEAAQNTALARKIRTQLETEFGEEYAVLVRVVNDVRVKVKQMGCPVDAERWQVALDTGSLLTLIRKGDEDGARRLLFNKLNAQTGGSKK